MNYFSNRSNSRQAGPRHMIQRIVISTITAFACIGAMTSTASAQSADTTETVSDTVSDSVDQTAETATTTTVDTTTAVETVYDPSYNVDYSQLGYEYAYLWGNYYRNIIGAYFGYQAYADSVSALGPGGMNAIHPGYGAQTDATWAHDYSMLMAGHGYNSMYYYNPYAYDASLYSWMGQTPYHYYYNPESVGGYRPQF